MKETSTYYRRILKVLGMACLPALLSSCFLSQEANKVEQKSSKKEDCEEQRPEFPGGKKALFEYIKDETSYPDSVRAKGIEGKVVVTFVVDKNGEVIDPEVVKGVSYALNQEALRVIRQMPKWQPGRQRCQAVKTQYKVPINFQK